MTAREIVCPSPAAATTPAVFLAGGITGCRDWQTEAIDLLPDNVTAYNPRRPNFPIGDPEAAPQQVDWEYDHLTAADVILFWFPESVVAQPIALLEYGAWALWGRKPVAVGAAPRYPRAFDVIYQGGLYQPDLHVHATLYDTCAEAARLLGATKAA